MVVMLGTSQIFRNVQDKDYLIKRHDKILIKLSLNCK